MKRIVAVSFTLVLFFAAVASADEIRDDYSSYIDGVRSGKANEERMPPELLKKLKKLGRSTTSGSSGEVSASSSSNENSGTVGSTATGKTVAPPGDVIIINKSGTEGK